MYCFETIIPMFIFHTTSLYDVCIQVWGHVRGNQSNQVTIPFLLNWGDFFLYLHCSKIKSMLPRFDVKVLSFPYNLIQYNCHLIFEISYEYVKYRQNNTTVYFRFYALAFALIKKSLESFKLSIEWLNQYRQHVRLVSHDEFILSFTYFVENK